MAEILTGSPSSVCGENDDSPCLVPQRSVWGHALRGHVQTSEWAGLCSQGEHSWGWSTESGAEAEGHLEDVHRGGGVSFQTLGLCKVRSSGPVTNSLFHCAKCLI